ncbi:MAG: DNA (cytosine-5-)-methyltransferase [Anaerolineales bacterium]|nr:DNA (cytosine-5-)-methyltransferase [Anaerolineales bacterium]
MNFGSLFAGIGGFDLGLERSRLACAWQVEIDAKCGEVLTHHWPDVERYGDVHDVGRRNLESIDVICGGFPCQDLSVAGRRAGLAGERSGLWWQFLRVIKELEPKWAVIENVPGLLSSNGGRDMGTLVGSLEECGYWWAYRVLDAQYFGVAQRRRRVFIVGHLTEPTYPAKVLFEPESSGWHPAPSREAGEGTTGTVTTRVGSPDRLGQYDGLIPQAFGGGNCSGPINTSTALTAHGIRQDFDTETFIAFDTTQITSKQNYSNPKPGDPCHPLAAGAHVPAIAVSLRGREGGATAELSGEVSPALRCGGGGGDKPHVLTEAADTLTSHWHNSNGAKAGNNAGMINPVISNMGVRRLTPIECERLQGFPDDYTRIQWRNKSPEDCPDGPRYKALGNSMAVPVMRWIGERIQSVDSLLKESAA